MKKTMLFFMLLTSLLFVYELNLVLNEKGNWFFVWINVFIFFLALLALGGEYANEVNTKEISNKKSSNVPRRTSHVQKPFWGDSRKL